MIDRRPLWTLAILLAGYLWVGANAFAPEAAGGMPEVCFVRNALGVSCPSCGTTRSVMLLLSGDVAGAAAANPFGLLVAAGLLVLPAWIVRDIASGRATFVRRLDALSSVFRRPAVALPLAMIVAANWAWNLAKYP